MKTKMKIKFFLLVLDLGLTLCECARIKIDEANIILKEIGTLAQKTITLEEQKQALKLFQKDNGIEMTGNLDGVTQYMMSRNQCRARTKDNGLLRNPWSKMKLSYIIKSYPDPDFMDELTVREEIQKAFEIWEQITSLTFTYRDKGKADIDITFQDAAKGDGPGKNIVDAKFPPYGEIYFDDEIWTSNSTHGVNLFMAAVHAIGHTLGLEHASSKNSIMYPFIPGYDSTFELQDVDIKDIEKLYEPKQSDLSCPPTDIDAIFASEKNIIYVIKGELCWKFNNRVLENGYPKNINTEWSGLNQEVDAAYTNKENIYFVHGFQVSTYTNGKIQRTNSMRASDNIDAAVLIDTELYYFSGSNYWKFIRTPNEYVGTPLKIKDTWPGVPDNIDAVYADNTNLYFFKNDIVYRCCKKNKSAGVEIINTFFSCS